MRALRASLNAPPSTRDHWFLQEPTLKQSERRRFAWFADQQSHLGSRLWHWGKFIALVLTLIVLGGWSVYWLWNHGGARSIFFALVALVVAQRLFWRWLTRGRRFEGPTPRQKEEVSRIRELEDHDPQVQNKMASLVILKPGWMTWFVTRVVLGLFNLIYRTWFTDITPGRLSGLHTIHFGHWTVLDLETEGRTKQKALMFLSNYDGSWETYLDDFIATLYNGVVAIWAGGVGFPRPLDGPSFKSWARTRMSVWHAWYRAYPTLTVANIDNNNHIRRGLLDLPGTDDAARLWLSRFGSLKTGNEHIDAPGDALDTHDIQGMVLSGYAHLPYAKYVPAADRQARRGARVAGGAHSPRHRRPPKPAWQSPSRQRGVYAFRPARTRSSRERPQRIPASVSGRHGTGGLETPVTCARRRREERSSEVVLGRHVRHTGRSPRDGLRQDRNGGGPRHP